MKKYNCIDCKKDITEVGDNEAIWCEKHGGEACEACYIARHKECDN